MRASPLTHSHSLSRLLAHQLDLLFRMTNAVNVEFIVEKLLSYLPEGSSDDHFRTDLVSQISQVPSPHFFSFHIHTFLIIHCHHTLP